MACWALIADALLISGNAVSRMLFGLATPELLDLQWQFLTAIFLLSAGYLLQRDEHMRIAIFARRFGERGLAWLDLVGHCLILLPLCVALIWLNWPFVASLEEIRASQESVSALSKWILKGVIPVGFALLALQALAEAVRCYLFLHDGIPRRTSWKTGFRDGPVS